MAARERALAVPCSRPGGAISLRSLGSIGWAAKYRLMGEWRVVAIGEVVDLQLPVARVLRFQWLADLDSPAGARSTNASMYGAARPRCSSRSGTLGFKLAKRKPR